MRSIVALITIALVLSPSMQFSYPEQMEALKKDGWEVVKNVLGNFKAVLEKEDSIEHLIIEGFDTL